MKRQKTRGWKPVPLRRRKSPWPSGTPFKKCFEKKLEGTYGNLRGTVWFTDGHGWNSCIVRDGTCIAEVNHLKRKSAAIKFAEELISEELHIYAYMEWLSGFFNTPTKQELYNCASELIKTRRVP